MTANARGRLPVAPPLAGALSLVMLLAPSLGLAADESGLVAQASRRTKRGSRQAKGLPPAVSPAPASPPAPAAPPAAEVLPTVEETEIQIPESASTGELLALATELFHALDYDRVPPVCAALLAKPGVDVNQRLDAYLLQGSALAIMGNPEAEKPFRLLLRGRPDFDMDPGAPPKILSVFRMVQVEERALAEQARELERKRIIASLELAGETPAAAVGGQPLELAYRLRDPHGAVSAVAVAYRREREPDYSTLALSPADSGQWRGTIPGEWTESTTGFDMRHFVKTLDAAGAELLTLGTAEQPMSVAIAPGEVPRPVPFYRTSWFWGAVGAALAVAGVAGYVVYDQGSEIGGELEPVYIDTQRLRGLEGLLQ